MKLSLFKVIGLKFCWAFLLNPFPESVPVSNTGIKDPFNDIFDDNIQNEQQGTLQYDTGQNLNILNPEPLFYNTNPFETQTTKQPDKDLALLLGIKFKKFS